MGNMSSEFVTTQEIDYWFNRIDPTYGPSVVFAMIVIFFVTSVFVLYHGIKTWRLLFVKNRVSPEEPVEIPMNAIFTENVFLDEVDEIVIEQNYNFINGINCNVEAS